MTTEVPLLHLAKTIRSKNAGVDHVTFDIIFTDREVYEHVRDNELLAKADILEIYGVAEERVPVFVYFDPAKAVKFTIRRSAPSGSPGEHDMMGAQEYPPLLELSFGLPDELATAAQQ